MSTKAFFQWFKFGVSILTPDGDENCGEVQESILDRSRQESLRDGSRRRVFVQVS